MVVHKSSSPGRNSEQCQNDISKAEFTGAGTNEDFVCALQFRIRCLARVIFLLVCWIFYNSLVRKRNKNSKCTFYPAVLCSPTSTKSAELGEGRYSEYIFRLGLSMFIDDMIYTIQLRQLYEFIFSQKLWFSWCCRLFFFPFRSYPTAMVKTTSRWYNLSL